MAKPQTVQEWLEQHAKNMPPEYPREYLLVRIRIDAELTPEEREKLISDWLATPEQQIITKKLRNEAIRDNTVAGVIGMIGVLALAYIFFTYLLPLLR